MQDEWVRVADILPPSQKIVIIPGGLGYHVSGLWYSIMDYGMDDPKPVSWEVRYWMPLPKPPKQ